MLGVHGLTDVHSGEDREDVGLQEGDEQFERHQADREGEGHDGGERAKALEIFTRLTQDFPDLADPTQVRLLVREQLLAPILTPEALAA